MEAFDALKAKADQVWAAWLHPAQPRVDVVIGSGSLAAGAGETLHAIEELFHRHGLTVED